MLPEKSLHYCWFMKQQIPSNSGTSSAVCGKNTDLYADANLSRVSGHLVKHNLPFNVITSTIQSEMAWVIKKNTALFVLKKENWATVVCAVTTIIKIHDIVRFVIV